MQIKGTMTYNTHLHILGRLTGASIETVLIGIVQTAAMQMVKITHVSWKIFDNIYTSRSPFPKTKQFNSYLHI